jgi:tryptophan synthase alpha chain
VTAAPTHSLDRLAQRFADVKAQGRAALVTFVTAGDPDLETSAAILEQLPCAGADVIELGVPFTDPMADGPAIQEGNIRALGAGVSLAAILDMVATFRGRDRDTPLILMGYLNPILAFGVDKFINEARACGVDGLIIVDLPPEEDAELGPALRAAGLHLIRLATPTTDAKRLPTVLEGASGFLYYVSLTGTTGVKAIDADSVRSAVARLKQATDLPIAVGFGVKTPEQAAEIARIADAVVVGSAIVSLVGASAKERANDTPERVASFVATLSQSVRSARVGG